VFQEDWEGGYSSGWGEFQEPGDWKAADPSGGPGHNSATALYGKIEGSNQNGAWATHPLSGLQGVKRLCFSQWVKWSANYQFSGKGTKFMYLYTTDSPIMLKLSSGVPYIRVKGGSLDKTLRISDADVWTGTRIAPIGAWHHVEYMVELNSAAGVADGNIEVYYDGKLIVAW
jgi:hypothetical protein